MHVLPAIDPVKVDDEIVRREYGPFRNDDGGRTVVVFTIITQADGKERASFRGEVYEKHSGSPHSFGQAQGSTPRALVELWDRWHLNDMKAGCEHQEARYRATPSERPTFNNDYVGAAGDKLSGPCSVCGYKYGSAWLFEPLPDDLIAQCDRAAKVVAP